MAPVNLYTTIPTQRGSGSRTPRRFDIHWREGAYKWHQSPNIANLSYSHIQEVVTDLLNRGKGSNFTYPVLQQICSYPFVPSRVERDLTVTYVNQGTDAVILRVDAVVPTLDGGRFTRSFCLNVAMGPQNNIILHDIYQAMQEFRKMDPRYIVRPLDIGKGFSPRLGEEGLAVIATEWLEGYIEIDMYNAAESTFSHMPLHGLEVLGQRRLIFNAPPFARPVDRRMEDDIVEEMVRILAIYFDPATGKYLGELNVNNGDFVYRRLPDGKPSLRLVTARKSMPIPVLGGIAPHYVASAFIDQLITHRENSVVFQDPDHPGHQQYAIFTFTPTDVYRGIKKYLIEKYGEKDGQVEMLRWLISYKMFAIVAMRSGELRKDAIDRNMLALIELENFIRNEKVPPGTVFEI